MENTPYYGSEKEQKEINIWGETVKTFRQSFWNVSGLGVEAGTNGYCGGDTGPRSHTYFRIEDIGGSHFAARVFKTLGSGGIEMFFDGENELSTIIDSLKFIVEVLEEGAQKRCSKTCLLRSATYQYRREGG